MDSLYDRNHTCLFCQQKFTSKRVKVGRIRVRKVDADFCPHYHGENPNYYLVVVCPTCGFSYTESTSKVREDEKENLEVFLGRIYPDEEFNGPRDYFLALRAYERAIIIAHFRRERSLVLANLYLHIVWFHRGAGDQEKELENAAKALKYYQEYYEKDSHDKSFAKTMYIIGELHRQLGNPKEAVNWYARIINDQKIRDAGIIRKAREQWKVVRGYDD